jgi:hypothetical protein
MNAVAGAAHLGNPQQSSVVERVDDVDDLLSDDPKTNPAFPYASDGLLYNFVSGTAAATTDSAITVLIVEAIPPMTVTIAVPADVQIYGPIDLTGRLADIKVGDRVDIGTSFLSQGLRFARWINVNLITGWSELLEIEPLGLETAPIGSYISSGRAPAFNLTLHENTKFVSEEGDMLEGDPSMLKVGDFLYWTAVAATPAFSVASAIPIVVHALTRTE